MKNGPIPMVPLPVTKKQRLELAFCIDFEKGAVYSINLSIRLPSYTRLSGTGLCSNTACIMSTNSAGAGYEGSSPGVVES
ncbi:hypothetical protein NW758_15314 [Fusarium oxysporum]|nr:hypothetical protein NW758_15314 [Fusarium oxysporum]